MFDLSKKGGGRQALAEMFDRKIQTSLVLLKFNVAMRVRGGVVVATPSFVCVAVSLNEEVADRSYEVCLMIPT